MLPALGRERSNERGGTIAFIQSGKPTQNAYVEHCLNGSVRRELLDIHIYRSLDDM